MDAPAAFVRVDVAQGPEGAVSTQLPRRTRRAPPRILIVASLRWPLAARLAMAFDRLGCAVQAWCPAGHPLEQTDAIQRIHRGNEWAPLRSLRSAILAAAPDFILPCDDDTAILLARLHALGPASGSSVALCGLIERSLGAPASAVLATERSELIRLASAAGIRVPDTALVQSIEELESWAAANGFPAALKTDGSWGGQGVAIVENAGQARSALWTATHPSLRRALSHLILRRDPSHLRRRIQGERPVASVQQFISGTPANRAVACWRGEVLAGISVKALHTQSAAGPATVVQVIEHEEMSTAARRLVRALGLSGLCGLDFIIEASSGKAHLIEVNPRATPISHLALGSGGDLPAALYARLTGERAPQNAAAIAGDVIAMFPTEWRRNPQSPYLCGAAHDVPWEEPKLVRDCMELPWAERGLAARLRARLSSR